MKLPIRDAAATSNVPVSAWTERVTAVITSSRERTRSSRSASLLLSVLILEARLVSTCSLSKPPGPSKSVIIWLIASALDATIGSGYTLTVTCASAAAEYVSVIVPRNG